eukprot:jgi/Psemu1/327144/estExt_fgenesh1_pg.C_5600013
MFLGGYGLGANDTDVRTVIVIGSSGLFLFALCANFDYVQRRLLAAPFVVRWCISRAEIASHSLYSYLYSLYSYSSVVSSLGRRMASGSSGGTTTALSTLSRVTSVDAIKNLSKNLLRSALQSITRKECFARSDYIERLSIRDVSVLFRYAASRATNLDEDEDEDEDEYYFDDKNRFLADQNCNNEMVWRTLRMVPKGYQRYAVGLSLAYRDVLQNLEKIERGVHDYLRQKSANNSAAAAATTTTTTTTTTNSIELERAEREPVASPTLRELLRFEIATGVHKNLPLLSDRSAASGLLWTKRQLHYQTALLANSLEVPGFRYPSPRDAATAAYEIVYNDYHGWAVKRIFTHSFGGSPPLERIWLSMAPPTDLPGHHHHRHHRHHNRHNHHHNHHHNHGGGGGGAGGKHRHGHARGDDDDAPPSLCRQFSDSNSGASTTSSSSSSSATSSATATTGRSKSDNDNDNEVLAALDHFGHEIAKKWEDLVRMFHCGKEEKMKRNNKLISSSKLMMMSGSSSSNLILSSESHFDLNQLNTEMVDSSLRSGSASATGEIQSGGSSCSCSCSCSCSDANSVVTTSSMVSSSCSATSASSSSSTTTSTMIEAKVSRQLYNDELIEKSKRDVEDFVRNISPMVADLGKLIDELNMNDPSRA